MRLVVGYARPLPGLVGTAGLLALLVGASLGALLLARMEERSAGVAPAREVVAGAALEPSTRADRPAVSAPSEPMLVPRSPAPARPPQTATPLLSLPWSTATWPPTRATTPSRPGPATATLRPATLVTAPPTALPPLTPTPARSHQDAAHPNPPNRRPPPQGTNVPASARNPPRAAGRLAQTGAGMARPVPQVPWPTPAAERVVECDVYVYHEVPSREAMATQIAWFRAAGARFVAMETLLDALAGGPPPPPGCTVLTFDDGLKSQVTNALPALLAARVRATFFVLPGFHDGAHQYMAASDYRRLRAAGMALGAHTLNHPDLTLLFQADPGAAAAEVVESKRRLEAILRAPVDLFAYPFGAVDDQILKIVHSAGFRAAFTTEPSGLHSSRVLLTLPRWHGGLPGEE